MDFKEATDQLFDRVDHLDLAKRLGVSVASVRQGRLGPAAKAFRTSPEGWQTAVEKIAKERVAHYQSLIDRLKKAEDEVSRQGSNGATGPRKRARPGSKGET